MNDDVYLIVNRNSRSEFRNTPSTCKQEKMIMKIKFYIQKLE